MLVRLTTIRGNLGSTSLGIVYEDMEEERDEECQKERRKI